MRNESIVWCIQNCAAYVISEDAQVELNNITARIAELTESNARLQSTYDHVEEINLRYAEQIQHLTAFNESMQTDARKNTETIAAQKELLIKAESALTYANWDGDFSKQATTQDVINARDAIRAYLEAK